MPLRVPNPRAYTAAKAAAQRGYQAWLASHPQTGATMPLGPRSASPSGPRPQAVLFEGLNQGGMLGGEPNTSATPPDTTGAIGPNDYIEMVNSELTVYNRSTLSALASMSEEEFIGTPSTNPSSCDGQIRWDQQAERWEYAALDCSVNGNEGFAFGWSKTADPGNLAPSSWCRYQVPTGNQLFDYPKLGGDNDFLLIGVNVFEEGTVEPAEKYVGSRVVTIPKPAKGQTSCPSESEIKIAVKNLSVFTPMPANVYGSSATGYVVASEYPTNKTSSANKVRIYTVTKNSIGEPEWHAPTTVSVSSYVFPPEVPQPLPSTDTIDSSDTRLTQAVAAEDPSSHQMNVWTQHTVSTTSGLPSVVAWYELKAGSTAPVQAGTVNGGLTDNFAFNAAISPTARGNGAVINYNVGGATQKVELLAQSRAPLTAAGTMEGETTLATSEGIDDDFSCPSVTKETEPCRWGDYAGASPDPLHPAVVWGTGELNGKPEPIEHYARWKTQNFALTLRGEKPTAAFSVTTASPTGGSPVSFDASASSDPNEPIVAYEWSYGDGAVGIGEKPEHTYSRPGKYNVTLTVMDNAGLTSAPVTHEVTVVDAPPVASFAALSPTATVPATFDGSTSHDPDGSIASYEWSFGDGSAPAGGASPSHTYSHAGKFVVRLTVTDDGGLSASTEHEVTVADAAPTASFSIRSTAPTATVPGAKGAPSSSFAVATPLPAAGLPVGFDGSGSKDPDGAVTGYSWSFGDGTSGSGPAPSHVYTKAGSYPVKLTVTDNGGLSASTEQTIVVGPEPNAFAVVAVKPNKRNGSVALSVRLPGPGVLKATDAASVRRAKATSKATLLTRLARIFGFTDPSAEAAKKGKSKHKPKRKPAFVKPARLAVAGARTITIQMVLTSAGKAELIRRHGKLTVKLSLTFAPTYGSPASKTQVIRPAIVKPKGKKKRR